MYVLISIFSGLTIVLSMIFLANLNKKVGLYQTTLINFIVSSMGALLILLGTSKIDFSFVNTVPIHLYMGAVFAIMITMINSILITKIPAVYAVVLVFVGQMLTGILIDFFRFGAFPVGDFIGSVVILGGLLFNIRVDTADTKQEKTMNVEPSS